MCKPQRRMTGSIAARDQNARAEERFDERGLCLIRRNVALRHLAQRQSLAVARRLGQSPQQPRQGIKRLRWQARDRSLRLLCNGALQAAELLIGAMRQPRLTTLLASPLVELPQGKLQKRQAIGGLGIGEQALVKRDVLGIALEYEAGRRSGPSYDLGKLGGSGRPEIETCAGILHGCERGLLEQELVEVGAQRR